MADAACHLDGENARWVCDTVLMPRHLTEKPMCAIMESRRLTSAATECRSFMTEPPDRKGITIHRLSPDTNEQNSGSTF